MSNLGIVSSKCPPIFESVNAASNKEIGDSADFETLFEAGWAEGK